MKMLNEEQSRSGKSLSLRSLLVLAVSMRKYVYAELLCLVLDLLLLLGL